MVVTKFTPGPWKAILANDEYDEPYIETTAVKYLHNEWHGGTDVESNRYIAQLTYDMQSVTTWRSIEQLNADAALIAAAPDMYAALEDVTNDLEAYVDAQYLKDGKVYHPAMQSRYDRDIEPVLNARAALAKARGEQ